MSDLTEEAVAPKSIERQKVSTCLKVFSERTYHAIINHSRLDSSKKTLLFFCKLSSTGEQYLMSNREIVPLQKTIVCAQKLEAQMTPAWKHDVQHDGSSGKANKAAHKKTPTQLYGTLATDLWNCAKSSSKHPTNMFFLGTFQRIV